MRTRRNDAVSVLKFKLNIQRILLSIIIIIIIIDTQLNHILCCHYFNILHNSLYILIQNIINKYVHLSSLYRLEVIFVSNYQKMKMFRIYIYIPMQLRYEVVVVVDCLNVYIVRKKNDILFCAVVHGKVTRVCICGQSC